jgi:hypothetical protein
MTVGPLKTAIVSGAALAASLISTNSNAQAQLPTSLPDALKTELNHAPVCKPVDDKTISYAEAQAAMAAATAVGTVADSTAIAAPAGPTQSLLNVQAQQISSSTNPTVEHKKVRDYSIQLTFGPHVPEHISPTSMRFQTSDMDLTLDHVKWQQRTSMSYYNIPANIVRQREMGGEVPLLRGLFQWIDEPVNEFGLKFQKYHGDGKPDYALGISLYHPKMIMSVGGESNNDMNKNVHVLGRLDGEAIDKNMDLNDLFGSYRLSHKFVHFSVSADKNYTVLDGKAGALVCNVGGRLGIYAGKVEYSMPDRNNPGGVLSHDDNAKLAPLGYGATLQAGLTYMLPGGRFGLGVKGEASMGRLKYDFMDGTVTQNHAAQSAQVFILIDLFGHKK